MGSVVKTVLGVALIAVAIFVPGAQFLLTAGISLTMSGLQGMMTRTPKQNNATAQRLNKSLDPECFRRIVFGKTAGGADTRYWEVYGSNDEKFDEVIAVAGHQINSFQNFYIEEKLIAFSGTAATTNPYAGGTLNRYTNDGTVGNSAVPAGAGAKWTSASKFRGSAHYSLKWVYDQNKLPQGIPARYTCEVEGALLYDPRKDSTVGGSGSHRYNDQTTWQYSPTDSNGQPIGRNNALQVLWYLLGWRIQDTSGNQVLVCGRGVDPVDIDFSAFIAAANDAEAQGYYTDCILSTGDSHETNENILTGDGLIGTLIDPGGFWTYKINKDDTGIVDVSLGQDDVVNTGPVQWVPSHPLSDQFNRVIGTYINPSATTLYQATPYPQVIDTTYETADGFKKRKTVNFQAIQDPNLAQKISGILLTQTRWQGEFTAKFNYNALKTQLYGNVALTLPQYSFTSKLFKVLDMTIEADGVTMRLGETDSSIWTSRTPGTGTTPGTGGNGSTGGVLGLTGVTLANISSQNGNVTVPGFRISWSAAPPTALHIAVRYKRTGGTTYTNVAPVPGTDTGVDVYGVVTGVQYDVEYMVRSTFHVNSGWVSAGSITIGGQVIPPSGGGSIITDGNFNGGTGLGAGHTTSGSWARSGPGITRVQL